MQELFIGETIRLERRKSGQTQEQLCDGLCDPATLSRIETGKQTPSRTLASALLQRLDLPHDRYYAFLSANEAEAEALRTKIDRYTARFYQSLGKEKQQARLEVLKHLTRLEAVTEPGDNINRQYIAAMRAVLGREDGAYSFEVKLYMLLEAIRMTVPRFDPETLERRLYSIDETKIISQIAEAYSEAGEHEKAAGIFNQLLTYVRKHSQDVTHPSRYLSPAALNCSRELCLACRYEEALDVAELGRKTCLDYGYCQSLPGLLAVIAECRCVMGEYEQGRELYSQAYYLFKETGNASGLASVEEAARKRLGPEFPSKGVHV